MLSEAMQEARSSTTLAASDGVAAADVRLHSTGALAILGVVAAPGAGGARSAVGVQRAIADVVLSGTREAGPEPGRQSQCGRRGMRHSYQLLRFACPQQQQ